MGMESVCKLQGSPTRPQVSCNKMAAPTVLPSMLMDPRMGKNQTPPKVVPTKLHHAERSTVLQMCL